MNKGEIMAKIEYIIQFSCNDFHCKNLHIGGGQFYRHPCMAFLLKGQAEFFCDGIKYEVNEGDLVYISRGTKYYSMWKGEPDINFYAFHFNYSKATEYDDFPFQVIRTNVEDREILRQIIQDYEDVPLKSLGLFYTFLDRLYLRLQSRDKGRINYQAILPALEYMDKEITKKFSVKQLAELCLLSESHFFTLFKQIMGCAPIQYKNNLLIQKSLELLSSTDMTIEEISYKLGFSYPSYFRKVFKSLTGKNPKETRRKSNQ